MRPLKRSAAGYLGQLGETSGVGHLWRSERREACEKLEVTLRAGPKKKKDRIEGALPLGRKWSSDPFCCCTPPSGHQKEAAVNPQTIKSLCAAVNRIRTLLVTYGRLLVRSLVAHHQHHWTPEGGGEAEAFKRFQGAECGDKGPEGLYLKELLRSMFKSLRLEGKEKRRLSRPLVDG